MDGSQCGELRGFPRRRPAIVPVGSLRRDRRSARRAVVSQATPGLSCAATVIASNRKSDECPGDAADRRARVQAERDKLAEKLRAKTQEAKELREARTGEITPIT